MIDFLVDDVAASFERGELDSFQAVNLHVAAWTNGAVGDELFVRVVGPAQRAFGVRLGHVEQPEVDAQVAERRIEHELNRLGFWASRSAYWLRYLPIDDLITALDGNRLGFLREGFVVAFKHSEGHDSRSRYMGLQVAAHPGRAVMVPLPASDGKPATLMRECEAIAMRLLEKGVRLLPRGCQEVSYWESRLESLGRQEPQLDLLKVLKAAWQTPPLRGIWQQIHTADISGDLAFLKGHRLGIECEIIAAPEDNRLVLHIGGARAIGPDLSFDIGPGPWPPAAVLVAELRFAAFLAARGYRPCLNCIRRSPATKVYRSIKSTLHLPFAHRYFLDTDSRTWS